MKDLRFISIFLIVFCVSIYRAHSSSICEEVYLGKIANLEKRSFLYNNLLKNDHLTNGTNINIVDDINFIKFQNLKQLWKNKYIESTSSFEKRLEMIKNYELRNVFAAPGHRQLRNKAQVHGLTKYMKESNGGNFEHDKILLNIVVDKNNEIQSLDLWNAHHRFVAYMDAGYKNIGELNPKNIEILVNGKTPSGERWDHYLSIAGVDEAFLGEYRVIAPNAEIRQGTIGVSGRMTNYQLGSRNTIGQLRENTNKSASPRVGVYFGTFDPIHEGHMQILKNALETQHLDEIIIVPNINPIHKSGITSASDRLEMIAKRIRFEDKINLYVGDSAQIIDQFGRNPFFERMTQTYGTYDLYQIIGSDSYQKLVQQNAIRESHFRKYIVFQRKDEPRIESFNSEKVIVSDRVDDMGLSSTEIRTMIQNGKVPDPNQLDDSVYQYIKESGLYSPIPTP